MKVDVDVPVLISTCTAIVGLQWIPSPLSVFTFSCSVAMLFHEKVPQNPIAVLGTFFFFAAILPFPSLTN